MKNIYQLVKPLIFIVFLTGTAVSSFGQTTLTDGPMNLQIRADAFWKRVWDETLPTDNSEEKNKIWFQDNSNLDGSGWVGGQCFPWAGGAGNGEFPRWSETFNTTLFNYTYNTANTPRYFNAQLEGWEDDSAFDNDCRYDGPCSVCLNADDSHCEPVQLPGNYEFRSVGPPCTWNVTEVVPAGGGECDKWGARFSSKYTPPVPTVSGPGTACGSASLLAAGATYGGTYNWYSTSSGSSGLLFTGNPYVINTPGTYTVYVETQNSCTSLGRKAITVTVNPSDNANYSYSQNTYCKNSAINPSPTITGISGLFSSTPSGLVFSNTTTGQINLAASAPGTYTITYATNGSCPNTLQRTVTIVAADDPTFNYSQTAYCANVGSVSPTISGLNGGNFSVTPSTGLSITPSNGVINTSTSTPGLYTIQYSTAGSCPATLSRFVTINASDDASFNYSSAIYCQDSPNPPIPNITGTSGGSFNSSPFGLVINPGDGTINLGASLTGIPFTIQRTTNGACPATQAFGITIVDNPNPPVAASPAPICQGVNNPQLSAAGLGGTINWYDSPSIGTLLQANSSVYNPVVNTPGTYDFYVEEVGQSSCASARTQVTLLINPLPLTPSVTQPTPICIGDGAPVLSASGNNAIFNWYDALAGGILLQGNSSNYTPPVNTVGTATYYVSAIGPGNCFSAQRAAVSVTVNPLPLVGIATTDNTLCGNDAIVPIFGFPNGGSIINPPAGVIGSAFDPSLALVGNTNVTYKYTDVNGCVNTASQPYTIYAVPAPVITTSGTTVLCNGGDVTLDAGPGYTNYQWNTNPVNQNQSIIVNSSGSYAVTVISTDGCTGQSVAPITVELVPDTFVATTPPNYETVFCVGNSINTVLDAGSGFVSYLWTPTSATSQTINVTTPGDYAVTVTNPLGCVFVDTISVSYSTVSALITADGPTLFCLGDSVSLSVNPAYSYQWTSGSTTQGIEVTRSGSYGVLVKDIYGCEASDTLDVTVDLPPMANFNYGQQSNTTSINFFDFTMNADSYNWSFGDGSPDVAVPNPTHSYPNPGEYIVTLTVNNTCGTDIYVDTISVKIVSVPELAIDKFAVYPNPTDGNLEVRFTSTINQGIEIRVVNAMGQLVNGEVINNFSGQFNRTYNLSNLAAGMYMFQIVTERGVRTERIILAK